MQLPTAGLLVIRERKLLLAFSANKQAFYLPGGKINAGETAEQALAREIKEELNLDLKEEDLRYYTHITAPAFGEQESIVMEQECFFCEVAGEPQANAEIATLDYFDCSDYHAQTHRAPGVVMVMRKLKEDGMID
jgi:8-oxo-dGTP pyrophosphatase MutT (NUDIX family)